MAMPLTVQDRLLKVLQDGVNIVPLTGERARNWDTALPDVMLGVDHWSPIVSAESSLTWKQLVDALLKTGVCCEAIAGGSLNAKGPMLVRVTWNTRKGVFQIRQEMPCPQTAGHAVLIAICCSLGSAKALQVMLRPEVIAEAG